MNAVINIYKDKIAFFEAELLEDLSLDQEFILICGIEEAKGRIAELEGGPPVPNLTRTDFLKQKMDFLRAIEAIASDPCEKFKIMKAIEKVIASA